MPAEDDFSMTRSPLRRGQRAGGDSDSRRPSPSPRAELCDMIPECNLALIPNVGINRRLLPSSLAGIDRRLLPSALAGIDRRLLVGSTVGSCWDRPSAFAGIDRKLQGELC
jgi:hypothetical protein